MEQIKEVIENNKQELKEKGKNFLKKNFFVICAVIFALLLLRQCNVNDRLEGEVRREHNNLLASQDSVRFISNKAGNSVYEKSAYELKMSELSKENKDLIGKLDLAKRKTPEVVIQTVTKYIDVFRDVPTKVHKDEATGQEFVSFTHNPELPGQNFLRISGKIPYEIKINQNQNDLSLVTADLISKPAQVDIEQKISIVTGLYRDPKSKRLMTRVSTDYPGITFSDINSFKIEDTPENRKTLMQERKRFGIGLNAGFGYVAGVNGISPGIYLGVGLHFSPKFLQTDGFK
jgi:hypothetical protein